MCIFIVLYMAHKSSHYISSLYIIHMHCIRRLCTSSCDLITTTAIFKTFQSIAKQIYFIRLLSYYKSRLEIYAYVRIQVTLSQKKKRKRLWRASQCKFFFQEASLSCWKLQLTWIEQSKKKAKHLEMTE